MRIEFTAKILPCEIPAQNGDFIPRQVLQNLVDSKETAKRLENGLINGGMSHRSRVSKEKGIPDADQILVDGNIFYKATRLWISGQFLYARFVLLDRPDLDGSNHSETAQMYNTFKMMLLNGIKPPMSSCIRAYWDESICREIVFIRGADITMQPGYVGSEITEIEIFK